MDMRQLEQLETFSRFFEFLAKPEEYKKIIADAKKAVSEMNEVIEKQRKITDFDKWATAQKAALGQREAAVVASEEALKKRVEDAMKKVSERELRSIEKEQKLNQSIASLRDMDAERKQLDQFYAELMEVARTLDARKEVLDKLEAELKAKAEALTAIIGK